MHLHQRGKNYFLIPSKATAFLDFLHFASTTVSSGLTLQFVCDNDTRCCRAVPMNHASSISKRRYSLIIGLIIQI